MGIFPHRKFDYYFTYSPCDASKVGKSQPSYKIFRHEADGSCVIRQDYFSNQVFVFTIKDAAKSANVAWPDGPTGEIKLLGFWAVHFSYDQGKPLETINCIAFPRDSTAYVHSKEARLHDRRRVEETG